MTVYVNKAAVDSLTGEFKKALKRTVTYNSRRSGYPADDGRSGEFSISKALRGLVYEDWMGADVEKRAFAKSYGAGSASAGGVFAPDEFATEIIGYLHEKSVVEQLGVTVVPMKSLKRNYGAVTNPATISWSGEAGTISEDTSLKTGEKVLELCKAVCRIQCSSELLRSPGPDADAILRKELGAAWATQGVDRSVLRGLGGTQPTGLYYNPRIHNTDLSGGLELDHLIDGEQQLMESNARNTGWVTSPAVVRALAQMKDANGRNLIQPRDSLGGHGVSPMAFGALYGKPLFPSNQVPKTNMPSSNESFMVFGDWEHLYLGRGRFEIRASEHYAWNTDEIDIRLVAEIGVMVAHPEAFVKIVGINVTL